MPSSSPTRFVNLCFLFGTVAVCGCSDGAPDAVGSAKGKTTESTLLCDYKTASFLGASRGEVTTQVLTIKKVGGEIVEVNDSYRSYTKEKTVVRTDISETDGSKHPAYAQLVVDDRGMTLQLEVTIDKFTHETVIDKAGNYSKDAGLMTMKGTCREGKPVF